MREDEVYLQHIAESITLIEQYVAGEDGEASARLFLDDRRTQDAVLRRLETLADAARQLSEGLRARHAEIPWRQINDFRNVLAHAYVDIRLDRVWEVIEGDLAALKTLVHDELQQI